MNQKQKVVLTDYEYTSLSIEKEEITKVGVEFIPTQCRTEEELMTATRYADAIIVQYAKITKRVINNMERCRVIVRYGVGVDSIDLQAATEHGIMVCNVPTYGLEEVANHTLALLLDSIRKITFLNNRVKTTAWHYSMAEPIFRITGRVLGLLAFGNIAQLVARRAQSFGMEILVYDPNISSEYAHKLGVKLVDFESLIREADFLSIHCPLNNSTRYLFNKDVFKKMKSTAILVNTARGSLIKESDLIEALEGNLIAGAALDVTETEPLQRDSKLLKMENVIITPHAAWYSEEAQESLKRQTAKEAARVVSGLEPLNLINREVLPIISGY